MTARKKKYKEKKSGNLYLITEMDASMWLAFYVNTKYTYQTILWTINKQN